MKPGFIYFKINFFLFFVFTSRVFASPLMGHKMVVATPSALSAEMARKIMDKKAMLWMWLLV